MKNIKSKAGFALACSKLVSERDWVNIARQGKEIELEPELQKQILELFSRWYPKENEKYSLVMSATDLEWSLDATGKSGCFLLVGADGQRTTISTKCKKHNIKYDIIQACRGSIHFPQILPMKTEDGTEIDHYNEGGFIAIYNRWRETKEMSDKELSAFVVKNEPKCKLTAKYGFYTFCEPLLSDWLAFHMKNSELQELTHKQHVEKTKERRLIAKSK
jgi:hypothetical protein